MITGCSLGGLAAFGQPAQLTGRWDGWAVQDAGVNEFTETARGVAFQRSSGTSDPFLSRHIPYSKHYFQFKARYRTDGKLSPAVYIYFLPPATDIRPLVVIRLPATEEWTDFETTVAAHDAKQAALEMRIYPGTVGPDLTKEGGLAPLGHHPGRAEFEFVTWTRLPQPVNELTRGPVAFATSKHVFKKAGDLELAVHVDRPKQGASPQPAVVWFHGGGFIGGTPDNCLPQATYLASRGITCIRPQYRLVNEGGNVDVTLEDATDAINWVRQHGGDLGIDPRRLIIAGTSAGAVLGSVLAQRTPECIGFIGLAGYYDMVTPGDSAAIDRKSAFFLFGKDPAILKRGSAIHQIRHRPPPAFLVHGLLDSTIDPRQSTRFAAALKSAGGRVELVLIPWLNHVPNFAADEVFQKIETFMREL